MWDLWCTRQGWESIFSKHFNFPSRIIPPSLNVNIHSSAADMCNLAYSLQSALKVPKILQATFRDLVLIPPFQVTFCNVALFFVSLKHVVNRNEIVLSMQHSIRLCTSMSQRTPHIPTGISVTIKGNIGPYRREFSRRV